MRLIDADELMEHAWRDKLDSRELIAQMIDNAPTVKEISTKIPINVFERLISQQPKTGHWIDKFGGVYRCSCCREIISIDTEIEFPNGIRYKYCPNCGAKMESEDKE